ncbi:MAG: hypothetical protein AAGJ73_12070 [Pseudomonadota bacterium]
MTLIDQAFLIWERRQQPRRAGARLVACASNAACASHLRAGAPVRERPDDAPTKPAPSSRED